MKSFKSSTSGGKINLQISFDKIENANDIIMIEYHKLAAYKARHQIAWKFIDEIKKIIMRGGSSNPKWSWSYWERKSGEQFMPKNDGRVSVFTQGFRNDNKKVVRYAVHPTTFLDLRKHRKFPYARTYAMLDTGQYIDSFKSTLYKSNKEKTEVNIITSKYSWYTLHEYGFSYEGHIVKRPHVRPAYEALMNKSNRGKLYIDEIAKELKTYVDYELSKKNKVK